MTVGLVGLDNNVAVDSAFKGEKSFQSVPPVAGLSHNVARVLKFVFFTHLMRVKEGGSYYRLLYSVPIPDPRGCISILSLQSSGFVTHDCPEFSKCSLC